MLKQKYIFAILDNTTDELLIKKENSVGKLRHYELRLYKQKRAADEFVKSHCQGNFKRYQVIAYKHCAIDPDAAERQNNLLKRNEE